MTRPSPARSRDSAEPAESTPVPRDAGATVAPAGIAPAGASPAAVRRAAVRPAAEAPGPAARRAGAPRWQGGWAFGSCSADTADAGNGLRRPERLAALARSRQLDASPDEAFDAVTRLCARLLRVPIALVTLIDDRRQFFRSAVGLAEPWASRRETPLSHSFCQHVLGPGHVLLIDDAGGESPLATHPAVTELGIRAYAGVPVTYDGEPVGALCAGDRRPRRWSARDLATLQELAALVRVQIERDVARAELQHALSRISLSERRKDMFLATLAHELRNPLAPIRNSLHVLRHATADLPAATQPMQTIDRQVEVMRRLIGDLIDVDRIGRDVMRLEVRRVRLDEVLDSAIESVKPTVEARGLVLEQRRPDPGPWLDADPVRLAQVLVNLLANAAKFTPEGGRIELDASVDGAGLTVTVRDTGIGIDPDVQERIFEMFVQSAPGAGGTEGGLGVGLALARRLVELHGGTLSVASEGPGRGATFTVLLPLRRRDADANGGESAQE